MNPSRGKFLRLALEATLVVLAGLLAVYRTRERDFWFHLAAGRSLLEDGLPSQENWCLAAYGQWPWLGEWLYHVSLYLVREGGGDLAVALWRALWAALAMGLALGLVRTVGAGWVGAALLSLLTLDVVRPRLAARPEQITLAFVLLFLLVLERARAGRKDRTAWLIAPQVLWVNLHPMWILGPLLVATYALFEWLRRAAGGRQRALRWGAAAVLLYACGAISPRPIDTLTLRLTRDVFEDPTVQAIGELKGWSWDHSLHEPYTGLLVVAVLAVLVGGARVWRTSPALSLLSLGALLGGVALYRLQALAALLLLPGLSLALDVPASPRRAPKEKRSRSLLPLGAALGGLAAIGGVIWLFADAKRFPWGVEPQWDSVPVGAVALADSLDLQGPVLNTSWYGGYLLWVRGESHLPLQDTRNLGPADLRLRLLRARYDAAALDTLLTNWDFSYAVLEPPMSAGERLPGFLFRRPEWALLYSDDAGLLFVRRDRAPAAAVEHAYRWLSPDYEELQSLAIQSYSDRTLREELLVELQRAAGESEHNARAEFWLGLFDLADGSPRRALERFARVERLAPITPGLSLRQGMAYEALGIRAAARQAYRRALADSTSTALAEEALRRIER